MIMNDKEDKQTSSQYKTQVIRKKVLKIALYIVERYISYKIFKNSLLNTIKRQTHKFQKLKNKNKEI